MSGALPRLVERVRVIHVTGDAGYAGAMAAREALPEELRDRYRPYPFLHEDMTAALAAADLAVGRAGASTLAEAAAFALPTAIVPYPHAAGHQRLNAEAFAEAGAAMLIEDDAFDADRLVEVAGLLADPARHAVMSAAARELARPDAAVAVADLVLAVARRADAAHRGRDRRRRPRVAPVTGGPAFDAIATGSQIQRRLGVKTVRDEVLARHTTMRTGGPADLFAVAHNAFELRGLVRFARAHAIPFLLLGRGSNLVIADAGFRGLVIAARAEGSRLDGERYHADAGVPMARAATETQRAGLTGLEYGLAIPGTVGGAVWANAGAHGSDTASRPGVRDGPPRRRDGGRAAGRRAGVLLPPQPLQGRQRRRDQPGGDHPGRRVPPPGRRPGRRSRRAWTTSAAGGASTSRWASRPRARCSATRRVTPRGA